MTHYKISAREVGGVPMALLEIYLEVEGKWDYILGNVLPVDESGWCENIPYHFMERVATYFDNHPCESRTIDFNF